MSSSCTSDLFQILDCSFGMTDVTASSAFFPTHTQEISLLLLTAHLSSGTNHIRFPTTLALHLP